MTASSQHLCLLLYKVNIWTKEDAQAEQCQALVKEYGMSFCLSESGKCTLSTGYLISPKDAELALAIEVCLKGQLQAFTCDNHQDERVLQGLMARVLQGGRRPIIITSQFLPKIHDTRKRWGCVLYSQIHLKSSCALPEIKHETLGFPPQ